MNNILILGGTGAIGQHLVKYLSGNPENSITVTSRSCHLSSKNVTYIQGNAHDLSFVESLLQHQWSAIIDFMIYDTETFRRHMPRLLNATNQYVFLSSATVYAPSATPLTEDSPRLIDTVKDHHLLSSDAYPITKAKQENMLFQCGKKNWTIIRPYITFSEIRLQLGALEKENWVYRALKGRSIVFSNDIINRYTTLTYGSHVSEIIAQLIGREEALGTAFHIASDQAYKWADILKIYLETWNECLGYTPNVIMVEKSQRYIQRPGFQVTYDRLYDRKFDNSKIGKFVDVSKLRDTGVMLKRCLSDFLRNPRFRNVDWAIEAISDKLTHENTPFSDIDNMKHKVLYSLYRYTPYGQNK